MAKNLKLEKISKIYGKLYAVKRVDLDVNEGEFLTLLGPSGCGKTTTLRMIAGFETPDEGNLVYDGKIINSFIPQKRNFGIVFQSYALFPHMKVRENIAFGLKMHKYPKEKIDERINSLLELVGLLEHGEKYPPQLSGGMQQRVALARALAPSPELILLDEPLSALDAKIRVKLRAEIKQLQVELGITTVYVTHDQEEALSISDRVVVMKQGIIEQVDKPIDIYKKPISKYVADFVGTSNFFEGEIIENVNNFKTEYSIVKGSNFSLKVFNKDNLRGNVTAAVRPEKIEFLKNISDNRIENSNIFEGMITVVVFLGLMVRLVVRIGGKDIIVDYLEKRFEELGIKRGDMVKLYFPPDAFTVYKTE